MRDAITTISMALVCGACAVKGVAGWPGGGASSGTGTSSATSGGAPSLAGGGGGALPAGLPGGVCSADDAEALRRNGYTGVCWDPPGNRNRARLPAMRPGRRESVPGTTLFEMPEGRFDADGCVELQGDQEDWYWPYAPYDEPGGLAIPAIPDLVGMPLADALDRLDALDTPLCVVVSVDEGCDAGHGNVCFQGAGRDQPLRHDGKLLLAVSTDILDEGTPDERRRLPEVIGRPTDEVVADLARRGFTNVTVVENNLPCDRGVVCDANPTRPGFFAPDTAIELKVRRGRR